MLKRAIVSLIIWASGKRLNWFWFHTGRDWCRADVMQLHRVMTNVAPELMDSLADLAIEQHECRLAGGVERFVASQAFARVVGAVRRVFATNPETDLAALSDQEVFLILNRFTARVGELCGTK